MNKIGQPRLSIIFIFREDFFNYSTIEDVDLTRNLISFKYITSFKGSVTVRGVGMFMRLFEKSYKV